MDHVYSTEKRIGYKYPLKGMTALLEREISNTSSFKDPHNFFSNSVFNENENLSEYKNELISKALPDYACKYDIFLCFFLLFFYLELIHF